MNLPRIQSTIATLKGTIDPRACCGWMRDEVCLLLYSLVAFYRPSLVIQIGHLWGKSAAVILEAMRDETVFEERNGADSGDQVFRKFVDARTPTTKTGIVMSLDPNPQCEAVTVLMQEHGEAFQFVPMTSDEFFREYAVPEGLTILGIVDGDHSPAACCRDIENLAKVGAKVIVVDDTLWLPDLCTVAKDAAARLGYSFQNHPVYNGVGVLVKE